MSERDGACLVSKKNADKRVEFVGGPKDGAFRVYAPHDCCVAGIACHHWYSLREWVNSTTGERKARLVYVGPGSIHEPWGKP